MSVYPVLQILLARFAKVRTAQSRLDWHGLKLVLMEYWRVPSLSFIEGSSYTGLLAQPTSMDMEANPIAIVLIMLPRCTWSSGLQIAYRVFKPASTTSAASVTTLATNSYSISIGERHSTLHIGLHSVISLSALPWH
jgi:hypothetical protein